MSRRLLLGGAVVLAAALLYAAAGYWLAPRLLSDALESRAAELGLAVTVERLRTDPFRLTAELTGVELIGRGGNRLAAAQRARLDLAWASLWRDDWIVQQASFDSPYLEVVLGPGGEVEWPALAHGAGGGAEPARLRVRALSISEGTLRFLDRSRAAPVEVRLEPVTLEVENLATHSGEAQYRLRAQLGEGGMLTSSGTFSFAPRAAHGEVELVGGSLATAWQLAMPAAEPGEGELSARAAYAYEEGKLLVRDAYAEAQAVAYAGVKLSKLTLEAPALTLPPGEAIELAAAAQLEPSGSLSARGSVRPQPLAAELEVEAISLPLELAGRFLPRTVAVDVASGSVSGEGRLHLSDERIAYQGSAALAELKLEERDGERLLLGWKLARTDALGFTLAPPALEVEELIVQAPQARLMIEADGSVNFARMFPSDDGDAGEPLSATLRRLIVQDGLLHFADRSLETPFEVTIRSLAGALTGFSTAPGDPAQVALEGRVGEYGLARIRGTIDLGEPSALANLRASFRNVGLAQLTPYVVKFAGYRVRSGRVSADLRYRVREGRLVGQNELVFQELELGDKVQSAGAPDLPLELAVALLADEKGRIRLDIPVRGNLKDPQFDFGGLVARAIRNAVGKIVSAPFRALAGLFGGKAQALDEVRFEAGSAALSPPQEEQVAKVAQALAARPRLGVTVRGGYDPERDALALRRDAVRRQIAERAGYESAGPLDFGDPKILRAAERLYLERVGSRANLRALREQAPRYGGALVELLAYTLSADAVSAEDLALERARSVRAALVERGIGPGRVVLEGAAAQAEEDGVPTQLSLTTGLPAGETDLVLQAQRALSSAGFDPGPLDGELGPKTEAALRKFQQARGMQATGELDARTVAALGVEGEAAAGGTAAR